MRGTYWLFFASPGGLGAYAWDRDRPAAEARDDMNDQQHPDLPASAAPALLPHGLHRVEHYALYLLNGMAAAGSGSLTDEDIDLAIDAAERLASKLIDRGHIKPHE